MLTRSSLSKPGTRRAGHLALGWRVRSRPLPEHDLTAGGARAADAPLAGDFPAFPAFAPVRRRNFRRRDSRAVIRARGEPGKLRILRYPATPSHAPTSLGRESKSPCKTVFPPFIAVFDHLFGEPESKDLGQSITWPGDRFFHRLKTGKTVETAPHRIYSAKALCHRHRRLPTR